MNTALPDEQHSWNVQAQQSGGGWLSFGHFDTPEEAEARRDKIARTLSRPLRVVQLTTSYHLYLGHTETQSTGFTS